MKIYSQVSIIFSYFIKYYIILFKNTRFLGGLGWSENKQKYFFNNQDQFSNEACTVRLEFNCVRPDELFTVEETQVQGKINSFLTFVIHSRAVESWQIKYAVSQKSDPVFNFFSDHFLKVSNLSFIKKQQQFIF